MKKIFLFLFVFFGMVFQVAAQTPSASQTWTLTAQPIALPGGGQTVAGTEAGMEFQVTPNFYLRDTNLVTANVQGFYGGIRYTLPILATKLGAVSPDRKSVV